MVRIRMKRFGRKHRPYFRICATDGRKPRDGRMLEELGTYDPMVPETDARVTLNADRVDYWLSVGAQPSVKVRAFIKKYGSNGTHLEQQKAAHEKLVRSGYGQPSKPTAMVPAAAAEPASESDA